MIHISIVTPVYKAENCLHELYRRLKLSLEMLTPDFEIIMVEDCGGDCSWDIIKELAQQDARVKGIQFSRNFGQHYGITAGLDHCEGDWVVVMDCDLQDQPEEIVRLYQKASLYNHDQIEIGDNSRIDDFCLLSGKISIGKFVHITPYCNLAGGEKGIIMEDFSTLLWLTVFMSSHNRMITVGKR